MIFTQVDASSRVAGASRLVVLAPLALVVLGASGCFLGYPKTVQTAPGAVSPAQVSAAQQKWPDATEAQLTQGHDLFTAKCNGCHGYPDVATIADEKWPDIMKSMGSKADLDDKQTEAVLRFVVSSKASGSAPATTGASTASPASSPAAPPAPAAPAASAAPAPAPAAK